MKINNFFTKKVTLLWTLAFFGFKFEAKALDPMSIGGPFYTVEAIDAHLNPKITKDDKYTALAQWDNQVCRNIFHFTVNGARFEWTDNGMGYWMDTFTRATAQIVHDAYAYIGPTLDPNVQYGYLGVGGPHILSPLKRNPYPNAVGARYGQVDERETDVDIASIDPNFAPLKGKYIIPQESRDCGNVYTWYPFHFSAPAPSSYQGGGTTYTPPVTYSPPAPVNPCPDFVPWDEKKDTVANVLVRIVHHRTCTTTETEEWSIAPCCCGQNTTTTATTTGFTQSLNPPVAASTVIVQQDGYSYSLNPPMPAQSSPMPMQYSSPPSYGGHPGGGTLFGGHVDGGMLIGGHVQGGELIGGIPQGGQNTGGIPTGGDTNGGHPAGGAPVK